MEKDFTLDFNTGQKNHYFPRNCAPQANNCSSNVSNALQYITLVCTALKG